MNFDLTSCQVTLQLTVELTADHLRVWSDFRCFSQGSSCCTYRERAKASYTTVVFNTHTLTACVCEPENVHRLKKPKRTIRNRNTKITEHEDRRAEAGRKKKKKDQPNNPHYFLVQSEVRKQELLA